MKIFSERTPRDMGEDIVKGNDESKSEDVEHEGCKRREV